MRLSQKQIQNNMKIVNLLEKFRAWRRNRIMRPKGYGVVMSDGHVIYGNGAIREAMRCKNV